MYTFRASWNLGSSYSVISGIHILGSSYSVSMVLHFFFFMEAKTEISKVGIDEWKVEARIQIDGHVFLACLDDCHIHMATEIVTNYTFWTEKVFVP